MKTLHRTGGWSADDDDRLLMIIYNGKADSKLACWNDVAIAFGGSKDAKSCRLRWENQLKPDINHSTFDAEEDAIVRQMQQQVGNRWSLIAKSLTERLEGKIEWLFDNGIQPADKDYLVRRTDNQVKNRWHGVLKDGKGKKRKAQKSNLLAESSRTNFTRVFAYADQRPAIPDDSQSRAPDTGKRRRLRVIAPRPTSQLPTASQLPATPETNQPADAQFVQKAAPVKRSSADQIQKVTNDLANMHTAKSGSNDLQLQAEKCSKAMDITDSSTVDAAFWDMMALPELDFQSTAVPLGGRNSLAEQADKSFTFFPPAAEGTDFMNLDDISDWAKPRPLLTQPRSMVA